jgi:helix-turn-helix protein
MKNTIDRCSSKRAEILTNEMKKDIKESKKLDSSEKRNMNKELLK